MGAAVKLAVLLTVILNINYCTSDGLTVGVSNGPLIFTKNIKLPSVPLMTRTKNVFYNGNQTIKGIDVIDLKQSKGKVSVTSGGVGLAYTNIKLKSEKGRELDYLVQIYA